MRFEADFGTQLRFEYLIAIAGALFDWLEAALRESGRRELSGTQKRRGSVRLPNPD